MDMTQSRQFFLELKEVLQRLAAPGHEQVNYLTKLGTAPSVDELALELEDLVGLLPQLIEHGWLTPPQAQAIQNVDKKLSEMSSNPDLWTETALAEHPDWLEVRRLVAYCW